MAVQGGGTLSPHPVPKVTHSKVGGGGRLLFLHKRGEERLSPRSSSLGATRIQREEEDARGQFILFFLFPSIPKLALQLLFSLSLSPFCTLAKERKRCSSFVGISLWLRKEPSTTAKLTAVPGDIPGMPGGKVGKRGKLISPLFRRGGKAGLARLISWCCKKRRERKEEPPSLSIFCVLSSSPPPPPSHVFRTQSVRRSSPAGCVTGGRGGKRRALKGTLTTPLLGPKKRRKIPPRRF